MITPRQPTSERTCRLALNNLEAIIAHAEDLEHLLCLHTWGPGDRLQPHKVRDVMLASREALDVLAEAANRLDVARVREETPGGELARLVGSRPSTN